MSSDISRIVQELRGHDEKLRYCCKNHSLIKFAGYLGESMEEFKAYRGYGVDHVLHTKGPGPYMFTLGLMAEYALQQVKNDVSESDVSLPEDKEE